MMVNLPDPEKFGVPSTKPFEKVDEEQYHSLMEWM